MRAFAVSFATATCVALLPALAVGTHARAAPPARQALPADHPILGIWRLTLPEMGCVETYRFRADGTSLVTSAAEISESVYTIPNQPGSEGFYRMEDRVTRDNGKPDCSGNVMKPGSRVVRFIRFPPSGKLFVMCADASMGACIGPFERVRGEQV